CPVLWFSLLLFSSRRRHTRFSRDWSSDVCSSDLDGISVALIVLTTLTTVLVLIGAWASINTRVSQYYASMLVLEGLMIGVFAAVDAMLFYVVFDAMLSPMFIIIGVWGGPRRVDATLQVFLHTI